MPRHRRHSIEFKRQVVAEYQAGESAHVLGRQALEIEFLKGARKGARPPRGAPMSATIDPSASPSNGGAR